MNEVALCVALPLCGALVVALTGRSPNLRDAVTLVTAISTFAATASITPQVMAGARPELVLFSVLPGVEFAFRIEPLGMLFGLVSSSLWIVTSIYAFGTCAGITK